jgi:hypothetical protein
VRVEQEKLSERLASLFPAYPPQEAGIRGSGLGARQPELGDSGRDTEPKSGIPTPEPRTADPDPGGVGTKPECDVESTDNCPTSPSRIQHDPDPGEVGTKPECDVESTDNCRTSPSRIQRDAGIGDSEFGDGESDWCGVHQDDDDGTRAQASTGADAIATEDQSAAGPVLGLITTANRQALIPIPCYRTAPLPCALWPSASGSVAATSPARHGARAAK